LVLLTVIVVLLICILGYLLAVLNNKLDRLDACLVDIEMLYYKMQQFFRNM
jgi:K+-transporting ATPase A subunit